MSNNEYEQQQWWNDLMNEAQEKFIRERYKPLYNIITYRIEEDLMKKLINNNKTYLPEGYENKK